MQCELSCLLLLLLLRYMATPWLSSPHVQTMFLNFHGRPPDTRYLFLSGVARYHRMKNKKTEVFQTEKKNIKRKLDENEYHTSTEAERTTAKLYFVWIY